MRHFDGGPVRRVNPILKCWRHLQRATFPVRADDGTMRVCVPIAVFPVTGGTRAVLSGIAQITRDAWQLEYLTQYKGASSDGLTIHRFGTKRMEPWQFPFVWLYFLAGGWKLLALCRKGSGYQLILPQDGVFTAAFAGLVGKLAGIRVVCVDHGNLTLLISQVYRAERMQAIANKDWSAPRRLLARARYRCYWPSLRLLARISARCVDHFLVPGVAGDGVEEICQRLGIEASRITRFASMIDAGRYPGLDCEAQARARQGKGLAADAVVIAMVCRLAPEKGLDIALESIDRALRELALDLRTRVRVVLAGDGPLRAFVSAEIQKRGLTENVVLWGETGAQDVIALLGMSDIFLYTSTRGACFSMAILEAMASACAVIASPLPPANVPLLAQERGIVVPAGDAARTAKALLQLVNDRELCRRMGERARAYVEVQHNPAAFKQTLLRAVYRSDAAAAGCAGMMEELA